ncbi:hypothetical protein [Paraclostridium tenue]|uniref:Uncharacterized protein n=1 Tax=Paraclostridium tenue TaxID=1737 RepID=A0ABN1MBR2_9FIRM
MNKDIKQLLRTVQEHTRAIREFKYKVSMKYNNATNEDTSSRIIEKVHSIEVLYEKFEEDYYWLNATGEDNDLLVDLRNSIDEFHKEILSLK